MAKLITCPSEFTKRHFSTFPCGCGQLAFARSRRPEFEHVCNAHRSGAQQFAYARSQTALKRACVLNWGPAHKFKFTQPPRSGAVCVPFCFGNCKDQKESGGTEGEMDGGKAMRDNWKNSRDWWPGRGKKRLAQDASFHERWKPLW